MSDSVNPHCGLHCLRPLDPDDGEERPTAPGNTHRCAACGHQSKRHDEDHVSQVLRERPRDVGYTAWLLAMPDGPTRGRAVLELHAVASIVVAVRAMLRLPGAGE